MRIDHAQLRALAAVIREGSFDRAAQSLNVTPSAISQRVKALEDRIGRLLVKRGTPATATAEGQLLVQLAEQRVRRGGTERRYRLAHSPGLSGFDQRDRREFAASRTAALLNVSIPSASKSGRTELRTARSADSASFAQALLILNSTVLSFSMSPRRRSA